MIFGTFFPFVHMQFCKNGCGQQVDIRESVLIVEEGRLAGWRHEQCERKP